MELPHNVRTFQIPGKDAALASLMDNDVEKHCKPAVVDVSDVVAWMVPSGRRNCTCAVSPGAAPIMLKYTHARREVVVKLVFAVGAMQVPVTTPPVSEVNFVKAVTGGRGLLTRSNPT